MNVSNRIKIIVTTLVLATLVGSFPVLAQTGKQTMDQSQASDTPRSQAKVFRHSHRAGLKRLLAQLDLTDDQKTQIRSIFTKNHDTFRALHQQLWEKRMAMREATWAEPFDEALVRSQAQELAKLRAEMMVAHARLVNEALSVLTSKQKAKFNELREQRRQRFMKQ